MQSSVRAQRAVAGTAFIIALVLISRGPLTMSGEAPHHLAVSHSILHDRDVDLSNQYADESDYIFNPAASTSRSDEPATQRTLPRDDLGLGLLLAPAFGLAEALRTVAPEPLLRALRWTPNRLVRDLLSIVVAMLYAGTALITTRVAEQVVGPGRVTRLSVLLAFLTVPLLPMGILVFAEVPIALAATMFLHESLASTPRPWIQGLALALIPWLGIEYSGLVAAGLIWLLAQQFRAERERRPAIAVVAWVVGSYLLLCGVNLVLHGRYSPIAFYPPGAIHDKPLGAVAGLLANPDVGLFVVAPYLLLALPGAAALWNRHARYVLFAGAAFLLHTAVIAFHTNWWGGYSPPARLLLPLVPLLCPAVAAGVAILADRLVGRGLIALTATWSLFLTSAIFVNPPAIWTDFSEGRSLVAYAVGSGEHPPETVAPDADISTEVDSAPPLVLAARRASLPRFRRTLQENRDPDVASLRGETALMAAARLDKGAIITMLLAAGAAVDREDRDGWTALMIAVEAQRERAVRILLDSGADPWHRSRTGWCAVDLAAERGLLEHLRMLLRASPGDSSDLDQALGHAALRDHANVVRALLAAGADIDGDYMGRSIRQWATRLNRERLIRIFEDSGARGEP